MKPLVLAAETDEISMDIQILDFSRHIKEELSDEYA